MGATLNELVILGSDGQFCRLVLADIRVCERFKLKIGTEALTVAALDASENLFCFWLPQTRIISVWNYATKQNIASFRIKEGEVERLLFGGNYLFAGMSDGRLRSWNVAKGGRS